MAASRFGTSDCAKEQPAQRATECSRYGRLIADNSFGVTFEANPSRSESIQGGFGPKRLRATRNKMIGFGCFECYLARMMNECGGLTSTAS